jgi:hypothetical protein
VSDGPDNIILAHLRAIRATQYEHTADLHEIKERLGLLESQYASISRRVDRIGGDVERLNTRAGLIDAPEAG